jgi:cell wall-associated NlpC family hydrolase
MSLVAAFTACSVNQPRPFYSRKSGDYITPDGRNASLNVSPRDLRTPEGSPTKLRKVAESYLGVRYRFGGQSRRGFDCSGFVRQVFQEAFGIPLPHHSASIAGHGVGVSKGDLKPGDVVLFKAFGFINHAGIYMGDNWFIHSQSGQGVVYTRLDAPYFGSHYAGARRILTL